MISRWHILISGFTQDLGRPTGLEKLWLAMHDLSDRNTAVMMFPWRADWAKLAEFIDRTSHPSPTICCYAYSWGVGHGFVTLAGELKKRGHEIAAAVLCDGVYRSKLLPTWLLLNPLSLLRLPRITIPSNVHRVKWFYQRQNRPAGHMPVREKDADRPYIEEGIQLDRQHQWMDDAHEFQRAALDVAGRL